MKDKTGFTKITIPTYPTGAPESMPIFFEKRANQGASAKIYPMPYTDKLTDEKVDREYRAAVLENEYIKVVALPELGGKIHSAVDKTTGQEFVYTNKVIKPAMIALAGPWVSGGIEFNWPLHHRPTTFEAVDARVVEDPDGSRTVWMGELEPYDRTKGMVGLTVPPGRSYVKADVRLYNGTPTAHPFLWWANLAVEIDDNFKVVFPPDVECVVDHDRRAVLSWPVAKGRFETARPYDYGKGADIRHHRNIVVPSSFMIARGQSDMDFVGGYDAGKGRGVVTVADHHVAPGKKLWTWGNNDFGYKWCANLTDDGSRYVELMTGCFADNQPDFTYIAPYETKHFSQVWYPVRDIGEVKNATVDAAVNLEAEGDGVRIGFYATGVFPGCEVVLTENGREVYRASADLSPEKTFTAHLAHPFGVGLRAALFDREGKLLVGYTVRPRGGKRPVEPRKPSPRPKELATCEELYLHGKHLVQYKHFTLRPDDYFLEALRRDPGDARCNEAMGDLLLGRGRFEAAIGYYDKAETRLELRNANPEYTDVLYKRGLCKRYMGRDEEAYDDFYRSVWSYKVRTAGYYALAGLAAKRGDTAEAVRLLELSLETDARHLWAKRMLAELTGDARALAAVEAEDPLFDAFRTDPRQAIDLCIERMRFGLYDSALAALQAAEPSAMTEYYAAYLFRITGDEAASAAALERAEAHDWKYVHPNRPDDIAVLASAGTAMSAYHLGCLYYDRDRYADAAACWQQCVESMPFAPAYRGLALAYYDHLDRKAEAMEMMETAYALMPESDRIFYELAQLRKSANFSVADRLEFFETHADTTCRRDDCTLEYAQLLAVVGRSDDALRVLEKHRFHTYEGGEGNLTSFHAWLHRSLGDELSRQGAYEQARKAYAAGLTFPDNYGEEKSFFVNDAPLYLGLSRCARALGEADIYLEKACYTYGGLTPNSSWQALALREAGRTDEAEALLDAMLREAEKILTDRDLPPYFGVGAHAFMPFQYDVEKYNVTVALQLKGYALYARGNTGEVKEIVEKLMNLDCGDPLTHTLRELVNA